jgi:hypothetical protein
MFTMNSGKSINMEEINFNDLKAIIMSDSPANGLEYEDLSIDGSNSRLLFKSASFMTDFFKNMYELFVSGRFCDIVLRNENKIIKCHKIVLASASTYFKCLFTSGFRENENNCDNVNMEHICSFSTLELIVDFMYSGKVLITESNLQNLLMACKMLQVSDLDQACCMFLFMNLDSKNCLGIEIFSRECGCIMLSK